MPQPVSGAASAYFCAAVESPAMCTVRGRGRPPGPCAAAAVPVASTRGSAAMAAAVCLRVSDTVGLPLSWMRSGAYEDVRTAVRSAGGEVQERGGRRRDATRTATGPRSPGCRPGQGPDQPLPISFHSFWALFSSSAILSRKALAVTLPSSSFWNSGSLSALLMLFQSGR